MAYNVGFVILVEFVLMAMSHICFSVKCSLSFSNKKR